jgi:predicted MFS family arabinose efflux permease
MSTPPLPHQPAPGTTPGGLWRHPEFLKLWAGQTVSVFGTLVSRTALPFAAALTLHAGPGEMALLGIAELVPGFLAGLVAGAWVDRLPKRPVMIACDLARAAALGLVPLAALAGVLSMPVLYLAAGISSIFNITFAVAYEAYLPVLVSQEELVEGNSKLTASAAVAEFASFSSAGWLVQWLTAPVAILVDAASFLVSAVSLLFIRAPEPARAAREDEAPLLTEVVEGLRLVWHNGVLRALAFGGAVVGFAFRLGGTVFLLFVTQGLGFQPGLLGMIFAIGGLSSLAGALVAGRVGERFGPRRTLAGGLAVGGVGQLFVPLAPGANALGVACLVLQQLLTDPAITVFEIHQVSQRQAVTPRRLLGRMNASMRFVDFGAMLAGAALGGILGERLGLRPVLVLSGLVLLGGACILAFSPVGKSAATASGGIATPPPAS